MYQMEVEYTDTFGGEPNYCWVRRATIDVPSGASDREVTKRAKAAVGLTGVRGKTYHQGDWMEFRPYRTCTILMARVVY
jgi:hypothetical protein